MRWVFVLACLLCIGGCEKDSESLRIPQIVVVEAPPVLPYADSHQNHNEYETSTVCFVVRLEPADAEVESLVCRVLDSAGWQIDSFLLYDDGSSVEHWEYSSCQMPLSGDSVKGDGMLVGTIQSYWFCPNYPGAVHQFIVSDDRDGTEIQPVILTIASGNPPVQILSATVSPLILPPITTAQVVLGLVLEPIPIDSILAVEFNGVAGEPLPFTGVAGEGLWWLSFTLPPETWLDSFDYSLPVAVRDRFGYSTALSLESLIEIRPCTMDVSLTTNNLFVQAYEVPETLRVIVDAQLLLDSHFENLCLSPSFTYVDGWFADHLDTGWLTDDGEYPDQAFGDGIYTTMLMYTAHNDAVDFESLIRIRGEFCGSRGCLGCSGPHSESYVEHRVTIHAPN